MRRMENDLLFFHELIGNCSVEKDSKIYTISPKFGKGTMQSFEVMPGAEIVYSNVHITTPIQKNIQCIDRFIEVTYCYTWLAKWSIGQILEFHYSARRR